MTLRIVVATSPVTVQSLTKKLLKLYPKIKTLSIHKTNYGFYASGYFTNGVPFTTTSIAVMRLTDMNEVQWLRAFRDVIYDEHEDSKAERDQLNEERYGKKR